MKGFRTNRAIPKACRLEESTPAGIRPRRHPEEPKETKALRDLVVPSELPGSFAALRMTVDARRGSPGRTPRIVMAFGALAFLMISVLGRHPNSFAASSAAQQPGAISEPEYLSPVELNFSPDGLRLYVVCEGNDSVLAVDPRTRQVVARAKVGANPRGLALSPDGNTLYVSNSWSDTVSEIDARSFELRRTLKAGWGPVGLTTDRSGKFLYVANSVGNDVSLIDLAAGAEIKRFMTERYPEQVLLSRDGRRVYVSNILPRFGPYDQPPVSEMLVIDAVKQLVEARVPVPGAIELRHIAEAPKSLGGYLLVPEMRPRNLAPLIGVAQGWVITQGMAIVRPTAGALHESPPQVAQVVLDDIDYYFAGENGAAFTPDGRFALLSASEANTLTIIDTAKLARRVRAVSSKELLNRLDSARTFVVRRLNTGASPQAVAVSPDGRTAYVANRLDDTLSLVDLTTLQATSTLDLGGPKELTAIRRGERLFNAAKYCFQGQFACATCHPNNHLDGLAWNLETPQLGRDRVANRTLRGIKDTAPFKWNGHNPDLATQCGPRIAKFLFRSEGFNTHELEDLITYLNQIPLPPNRHLSADGQLTEAQERGKAVFYRTQKNDGSPIPVYNQCATCHPAASHYTSRTSFDVGSANKYDTISAFDTPQLDRVYEDGPYLHSGEALTLEEIWTVFNNKDTHGVSSDMSKEQLNDLIEFLKTL
jgi:YVTN family beta-propeller protein